MSERMPEPFRVRWPSLRGIFFFLLKLSVAVFLLTAMYKFGLLDFRQITTQSFTPRFFLMLAIGCAFAMGALAILGWRLVLLLSVQGISIQYIRAFFITVLGNLIGAFLPGIIAGDITKTAYLFRLMPHRRRGIAAAFLLDRLMGLYGLLILGSISAGIAAVADLTIRREILLLAAGGTLLVTVGIVVLFEISHRSRISTGQTKGFYSMLRRFTGAVAAYRNEPLTLLAVLGLSVASHALMVGTFICSAVAIHDTLPLATHFVLDPLAMLLNAVPVSPGGLGLAEGAFGFLFSGAGSSNGALVGLMGRLLLYAVSILVALVALLTPRKLLWVEATAKIEVRTT